MTKGAYPYFLTLVLAGCWSLLVWSQVQEAEFSGLIVTDYAEIGGTTNKVSIDDSGNITATGEVKIREWAGIRVIGNPSTGECPSDQWVVDATFRGRYVVGTPQNGDNGGTSGRALSNLEVRRGGTASGLNAGTLPSYTAAGSPTFRAGTLPSYTAAGNPTFSAGTLPSYTAAGTPSLSGGSVRVRLSSKFVFATKLPMSNAAFTVINQHTGSGSGWVPADTSPVGSNSSDVGWRQTSAISVNESFAPPTLRPGTAARFTAGTLPSFSAGASARFTAGTLPSFTEGSSASLDAGRLPSYTDQRQPAPFIQVPICRYDPS